MNNNAYISKRDIFIMNEECLNHSYRTPSIDYINKMAIKYNTNNLDKLSEEETREIGESGIVGKFLKHKFKLK
jgi:hypothetical protein